MTSQQSDNIPITNTLFPPPPPYYKAYANFTGESSETNKGKGRSDEELLVDDGKGADAQEQLNDLEKPRVDWINEEGRWMCFGEMYSSEPFIPTLASIGLPPFFPPEEPPHIALPPLIHSFLHTLLLLIDTLTNTARIPGQLTEKGWAHEGDQYVQHLTNLSATMMVMTNQLRGVQAESTLVLLMEKQLAARREQIQLLKAKCQSLSQTIRTLKNIAADAEKKDSGIEMAI